MHTSVRACLIVCLVALSMNPLYPQSHVWEQIPVPDGNIRCIGIDYHGRIYLGSDYIQGIYRSTDNGRSWTNVGMLWYSFTYHGIVFDSNDNVFVGTTLGIFRSTDLGGSWQSMNWGNPDSMVNFVHVDESDNVFISTTNRATDATRTYKSTDAGNSWTSVLETGLVSIVEFGKDLMLGGAGTTFLSTDHGDTWVPRAPSPVRDIVRDTVGVLYGYSRGTFQGNFYRSLDTALTWTMVGNGLPAAPNDISSIEAYGAGTVVVGFGNGGNVRRSTNSGLDFESYADGLTDGRISDMTVNMSGFLYASTLGSGPFRTTERVTSVAEESGESPVGFLLMQNYPNPFNPSTTIRYALPERSHVTLTVFNTLGQQVATLAEGEMEAGYHEVKFDASHLAGGVYLYRIQAGNSVQTRKLVSLR